MIGDYFYTTDLGEGRKKLDYHYEAVTGYVYKDNIILQMGTAIAPSVLIPVYRFFNPWTGDHFYTPDLQEGETFLKGRYRSEGIGWWMFNSPAEGVVALHRWWNDRNHFYTMDPQGELTTISGYTHGGIIGYLHSNQADGAIPLHRFTNGIPLPPTIWSQYVQDAQGGSTELTASFDPNKDRKTGSAIGDRPCYRLSCNGRSLYYAVKVFGNQPESRGYPLYIGFHGGGTNTGAVPNSNDGSWWDVFDRFYGKPVAAQTPCTFVAVRGISAHDNVNVDTYDLHSQPESFVLLQRLIMNLMLPNPWESIGITPQAHTFIDPNRVYLLGFSAGGNGVYQLSSKISDRFAAAVAGGGHPEGAAFENLANLPIRIQIGAEDIFSGNNVEHARPPPNLEVDTKLNSLQSTFGSLLYTHRIDIVQGPLPGRDYPGKEHVGWAQPEEVDQDQPVLKDPHSFLTTTGKGWAPTKRAIMPNLSADAVMANINPERWVAGFTRNPIPSTIVWNLGSRPPKLGSPGPDRQSSVKDEAYLTQNMFYWLYLMDGAWVKDTDVIHVSYGKSNDANWAKFHTLEPIPNLGFLLNHSMVNFSYPLQIFDSQNSLLGTASLGTPSSTLMTQTLNVKGDPYMVFSKMVYIEPQDTGDLAWIVKTADTLDG